MSKKLSLLAAVLVLCTPPLTNAQQPGCSSSFTNTSVEDLIAQNYQRQDGSRPTITLQPSPAGFTFHVVCLSSSGMRNMYRFVSIVAYFTTDGSAGVPMYMYGQFEFECVGSAWSTMSSLLDYPSTVRTVPPAAINASIRTDCAYCLKPADPMGPPRNTDPFNHCSNCSSGCTQPLCYTRDSAIPSNGYYSSVCCNYYGSNDVCMDACPSSSFPDANRTCVPCTLSCQNGGALRNDTCACNCSSSLVYGGTECTACQCQNGGTCSGSVCTCLPGYTGSMCENACPTSCPTGYYLTNCSCAPCTLSCQNGGVLRNDICACNCSSSLVYGGTECTACQCQNGGTCSGSVCTCPPGYTGSMCENACPTSCPAGHYLTNCSCEAHTGNSYGIIAIIFGVDVGGLLFAVIATIIFYVRIAYMKRERPNKALPLHFHNHTIKIKMGAPAVEVEFEKEDTLCIVDDES